MKGGRSDAMTKLRLLKRRECWAPTARGWLVLTAIFLGLAWCLARSANSFLCVTRPVAAQVLVVECWLPDFAMAAAVAESQRGGYKLVVTPGWALPEGWVEGRFKSGGDFAAANLAALGLHTNVIVPLPSEAVVRDRTYASALAVNNWLKTNDWSRQRAILGPRTPGVGASVAAVNVYSLGAHARRTRLLYQKALGRKVKVGIIACPDPRYDGKRWWASTQGFREVMDEAIAYLYARLLFHPN